MHRIASAEVDQHHGDHLDDACEHLLTLRSKEQIVQHVQTLVLAEEAKVRRVVLKLVGLLTLSPYGELAVPVDLLAELGGALRCKSMGIGLCVLADLLVQFAMVNLVLT